MTVCDINGHRRCKIKKNAVLGNMATKYAKLSKKKFVEKWPKISNKKICTIKQKAVWQKWLKNVQN